MLYAGIDAGSRSIKVVLYDAEKDAVVASGTVDQGVAQESLARDLYERLLRNLGAASEEVAKVVATGYGRGAISFADTTITEITCHARGVRHTVPEVRTIIEIGGQDSKLIRLDPGGMVRDFAMNDRCAAGTGRFLEILAARLEVPLSELSGLTERSTHPAAISSMCVVFAETEIIGLLAVGTPPPDIVAGVQMAIVKRVVAMAGRSIESLIVFTGGVALNAGITRAIETAIGKSVHVVPDPQMTGALGAAILAARSLEKPVVPEKLSGVGRDEFRT